MLLTWNARKHCGWQSSNANQRWRAWQGDGWIGLTAKTAPWKMVLLISRIASRSPKSSRWSYISWASPLLIKISFLFLFLSLRSWYPVQSRLYHLRLPNSTFKRDLHHERFVSQIRSLAKNIPCSTLDYTSWISDSRAGFIGHLSCCSHKL